MKPFLSVHTQNSIARSDQIVGTGNHTYARKARLEREIAAVVAGMVTPDAVVVNLVLVHHPR